MGTELGTTWNGIGNMTMVPPKYAAVRVRLTQADKDALSARAQRDDVPLSVVIRRAIRQYLNQGAPRPVEPFRQTGQIRSAMPTSANGTETA